MEFQSNLELKEPESRLSLNNSVQGKNYFIIVSQLMQIQIIINFTLIIYKLWVCITLKKIIKKYIQMLDHQLKDLKVV
jgi:hypothetical protein